MAERKIGVLTSGGDAPGMNAAIRAVVRTARAFDWQVFGIMRGYQGIFDREMVEMNSRSVSGIINRGGTILKSDRCMDMYKPEGRSRAAGILKEMGIDSLVLIGGNGTFTGAMLLEKEHGILSVGAPGTIDNDLYGSDYTIGFNTAVNTAVECIDKLRDTADALERVFLVEVMGRNSGFLAFAVGFASGAEEVLVPETPTDIAAIRANLLEMRDLGKKSLIIVVAEGDDAGSVEDIKRKLALEEPPFEVRMAVLGHVQRGGAPSALDRYLGQRLGHEACIALRDGVSGVMIGEISGRIVQTPYSDAISKHKGFDTALLDVARVLAR
jgi:6-phosphofructokinase 1